MKFLQKIFCPGNYSVLFLLNIFFPIAALPQADTSRIKYYTEANGLCSSIINDVVQDERGFLWIGTVQGLSRFDGRNFLNFYHGKEKNSLASDVINDLELLPENKLAIATGAGINCLDLVTGEFRLFQYKTDDRFFRSDNYFNFITRDRQSRLWAGSATGLFMLDKNLNLLQAFRDSISEETFKQRPVQLVMYYMWLGGKLVFLYDNHFRTYDDTAKKMQIISSMDECTGAHIILNPQFSNSENCLLSRNDSLFQYHFKKGIINPAEFSGVSAGTPLDFSYMLNDSLIVYCTRNNKVILHVPARGKSQEIILGKEIENPANNRLIKNVFLDRDKNLWVASISNLAKIPLGRENFLRYSQNVFIGNKNSHVSSLMMRDSIWWAGTYGKGLYRINPAAMTSEHFDLGMHDPYHGGNLVWNLRQHKGDTMWIGTQSGLLWFHEKNFSSGLVKQQGMPDIVREPSIICTQFQDSKNIIWMGIGAGNGLVSCDLNSGQWVHYNTKLPGCPLPLRHITAMDEDESGNLWMGTQRGGGLIKWERKANSFSIMRARPDSDFEQDNIDFIHADKKGNVWLLVSNYGIVKYNIADSTFKLYNRSSGLSNNRSYGCYLLDGNLWIATSGGLSCFNVSSEVFVNFTVSDGLADNSLSSVFYDVKSGLMFAGADASLSVFNPKEILKSRNSSDVYITSMTLFNSPYPMSESKSAELKHDRNFLRFDFSEINFSGSGAPYFEYMLQGLDKQWNKTLNENYATYSGIPPGEYIFRVKTAGGAPSAQSDSYRIIIHPPFWMTWWFRLMMALSVAVIIFALVLLRIRKIRSDEKLKTEFNRQLAEVKMKALRAQMNPHFIFNCLNSINKFILENDTEKASRYLSKFSKLIRMILENSEQPLISLHSEVEMLEAYLEMETNRFKTKFEYEISLDEKLNVSDIEIPPMLIQPYVENAIWHGLLPKNGKGELKISIRQTVDGVRKANYLLCIIRDNGIGRAKAKELKEKKILTQKSMGMKVTQERMYLLSVTKNKSPEIKITDLSENGTASGTQVELKIPL